MFGRKVGSSLLRLPLSARLPFRPTPFRSQNTVIALSQRFYASPGRPRKTVGEPSRPVKRAAKKTAKATDDKATKQVKAKKKTAAAKKAKAKPKKRTRKELTDEQKAAASVRLAKAKIVDLKKAALKPPTTRSISAYNAYCKEKLAGGAGPSKTQSMSDTMRPVVQGWKALSPAELEHYNHLAHTQTEANNAAYKSWVQSYTPEQIQVANRARTQLRRKLKDQVKGKSKYQPIRDERLVKRPATQFIQFSVNRQASGDFKNIPISERMKLISQEWKALNAGEKKKYEDLQKEDINRYSEEYNSVFGHMPGRLNGAQQVAAAA